MDVANPSVGVQFFLCQLRMLGPVIAALSPFQINELSVIEYNEREMAE